MPDLLLFVPSQNPLPVRHAHPHKPRLNLPPLVHRALHTALDADSPSFAQVGDALVIPNPDSLIKHDEPPSPASGSAPAPAGADADAGAGVDAEITLKLHLVADAPPSERAGWVSDALRVAREQKGLGRVDTLLVGWRGVDYKGKKTAVAEFFGCGAEGLEGGSGVENVGEEVEEGVLAVWEEVRGLVDGIEANGEGAGVKRLGTLYLPLGVLRRLVTAKGGGPAVNMLDTPDCHHLPQDYTGFAREHGVLLWAGGGGDGADPLPDADLHNVLHEFASRETISALNTSAALDKLVPLRADGLKYDLGPEAAVRPAVAVRWVLGYTVMSRTRNVVQDKGYIISASY